MGNHIQINLTCNKESNMQNQGQPGTPNGGNPPVGQGTPGQGGMPQGSGNLPTK